MDISEERVYAPGETIVTAGQPATWVYIILEGTARVVYSVDTPPHPRTAVVDLIGAGRLFGLISALDGEPYIAQLEAVSETRVALAPRQAFLDEMEQHPEVAKSLLLQLASFNRKTESWLISSL